MVKKLRVNPIQKQFVFNTTKYDSNEASSEQYMPL